MNNEFRAVKYDDDHFVLHLNKANARRLLALLHFHDTNEEADSLYSLDSYVALREALGTDPREIGLDFSFRHIDERHFEIIEHSKDSDALDLDEVESWESYKSVKDVIPDDRKEEVKRELRKVLETYPERSEGLKTNPLISAFSWSHSPQRYAYWSAWWERKKDANLDPPPPREAE